MENARSIAKPSIVLNLQSYSFNFPRRFIKMPIFQHSIYVSLTFPGGGLPYKKGGVIVVFFKGLIKRAVLVSLGVCSTPKVPQRELLRYLLEYLSRNTMTGDNFLSVPLQVAVRKTFKSRPQNRTLVLFKISNEHPSL